MSQTVVLHGPKSRADAANLCRIAPNGTVAKFSAPKRTLPQNDKLWALLSDVSRAKPGGRVLPPEKWKSVFMDAAGCKPEWTPSLDGQSVVCTGYRSSLLDKATMSEVIECILAFGAENEITFTE